MPRDLTNAEQVIALLFQRYPREKGWCCFTEVKLNKFGVGPDERRRADFVAVNVFSSGRGRELLHTVGVEVKVSRSDWLREIGDPAKLQASKKVLNEVWIAAPRGVVRGGEAPPGVGVFEAQRTRLLRKVVAAKHDNGGLPLDFGLVAGIFAASREKLPLVDLQLFEYHGQPLTAERLNEIVDKRAARRGYCKMD